MTKVGRHNDYKYDPSCIHIGDLKVPKTYISIAVGETTVTSDVRSPLSITFESICKTTVNGVLYRLASREDAPFTKEFKEDILTLTVNAHKTNRIQLKIKWVPVNVMVFSKKIEYNGEIQMSPLPKLLEDMHSNGTDIRICGDPISASHYLTLSDHVDYAYQIAVLRAIPMVTTVWTDFIQQSPDEVDKWLFEPGPQFLLPNTPNNYAYPDHRRTLLLSEAAVLLCYLEHLKHLSRLEAWVKCLGCTQIRSFNMSGSTSLLSQMHDGLTSDKLYAFSVNGNEHECQQLFKDDFNTSKDLWSSVISSSTLNLNPLKKKTEVDEITLEEEESTPRFSQRRKRRKVQRVSETDFFQFSHPSGSLSVEDTDSLPNEVPDRIFAPSTSDDGKQSDKIQDNYVEKDSELSSKDTSPAILDKVIEVDNNNVVSISNDVNTTEKFISTNDNGPATKRMKTAENSKWIVPQMSLAEAIRTTKEESEKTAKMESMVDKVDGDLQKLVLVEEVDLVVSKSKNIISEVDLRYSGRPNFKAFRKKTPTASNVTRTYLQLFDDNLLNEIRFIGDNAKSNRGALERIVQDFQKEMENVKGFQPVVSQLFVDEVDSDENDSGDAEDERGSGFSFLTRTRTADTRLSADEKYSDDEDERDEFTFAFSRK